MGCRDSLRYEDAELTYDPVMVLRDVILDGLLPAESFLRTDANINNA